MVIVNFCNLLHHSKDNAIYISLQCIDTFLFIRLWKIIFILKNFGDNMFFIIASKMYK